MSATGAGYDYNVSTFSPNGRVFQVEYAAKAVEKASSSIGIRCVDGVVLGVEKHLVHKMLVKNSNRRIYTADLHVGCTASGLPADARQLVNKARQEAAEYKSFYGSPIPGQVLADRLAAHSHTYTLYWYLRPFGCTLLMAVYDEIKGPQLYTLDSSATCHRYFAASAGKGKASASSELEKLNFEKITCREAVKEIAKIIYKLHDEVKEKDMELEMSWVCDESKRRHVFVPDDIKAEAIAEAKAAKEKEEMDSDDENEEKSSIPMSTTSTTTAK